MLANLVFN